MKVIYALLGLAMILSISTFLGASLTTTPTFNKIGTEDNSTIPGADTDISKIVWTESSGDITSATITLNNTDTSSHTYQICVITFNSTNTFSDTAGTSPDCDSTGTINGGLTGSATVTFASPLTAATVNSTSISIEQTG